MDSFLFLYACFRLLKLSLRPVTISFACSRPFGRAATSSLSSPLMLSLAPLLSLRDFEPASDLRNYPSNSHSVGLPLALQYFSELFNQPDGSVKDAVQVLMRDVSFQIIITIFAHCFPQVQDEYDSTTVVLTLRYLTTAATIHYQIVTPPVQRRFLPHDFMPTL